MDEFDNDLERDYKNPKFNAYLEDQPGANVEEYEDGRKSKIIIKNVRVDMSENGVKNLCKEYGDVCSVVRGAVSSRYCFVIFGSPDQAQYAIEKINRLYYPMRAEFAKSKDRTSFIPETNSLLYQPPSDNSIKISRNRVFQGPFVQKLQFEIPDLHPALTAEEYKAKGLINIDDTLNYFNEISLCDIFTERDIADLEANANNYKLIRSTWVYRPDEIEVSHIKKSLAMTADKIDKENEVRHYSHPDFQKVSTLLGKCKICGKVTDRQTKITKDFYCSIMCKQTKEETPGNNMADMSMNEEYKLPLSELHNGIEVVITSVINQNTVYVRPSDIETTTTYYHNLLRISMSSENAACIIRPPKPGDLVAVNVKDAIYMRAMVLKVIDRENIRVAYLDTGSVSIQKLLNLRKLHTDLKNIPIYVHKITLDGISTNYISIEAIIYLNKFVCGDKSHELKIRFNDIFEGARLYDHNEPINDDIEDLIAIKIPSGEGFRTSDYIGHVNRIINKETELVILDNSMLMCGEISCIQKEYFIKLQLLHQKVQYYGTLIDKHEPYAPRHEEICLVRLDGVWFRGICAEILGDRHPTIHCFDFGFYAIVVVTDIAIIPHKLLDLCYTNPFIIDGFNLDEHMANIKEIRERLSYMKTITVQKCVNETIFSNEIRKLLLNLNHVPQQNGTRIDDSDTESEVD